MNDETRLSSVRRSTNGRLRVAKKFRFYSSAELDLLATASADDAYRAWELRGLVRRDATHLTVNGHYEVPLDELKTAAGICNWLAHLSEKIWFHPQMLADFLYALPVDLHMVK